MANDLVSYSRAGDAFHYRWAAKRCLRLINPNAQVREIYIEGSPAVEKAGEDVIDVSEHSVSDDGKVRIDYYQLKHSTVQVDDPFQISDLKGTLKGFAARYLQHKSEIDSGTFAIYFTIISNRGFASSFKNNLAAIAKKEQVGKVFKRTIENYTLLTASDLESFCSVLQIQDAEGNYNVQKEELRIELALLMAGSIENSQIENLIALVHDKVLPGPNNVIIREDVLRRFGITSETQLFPAPAKWEEAGRIIERDQSKIILDGIKSSSHPVIVHAAGGVGKSIFCRQLIKSLPEGSIGIAYDCFGAGRYRKRTESRHKHRTALVQIMNELASKGLCDPFLVQNSDLDEDIMRKFLIRIDASIKSLKKATDSAQLYLLIDAADNAEMAATEYQESCFAHELLHENIPEDCKVIFLCRTARIPLLQPQSIIPQFELKPFSEEETQRNLREYFPQANNGDGIEFHRLTYGNPRVQANALDVRYESINALLTSLGSGMSVETQIEQQLNLAVSKIINSLPANHHHQINSICTGMASLPPNIPVQVLSRAANVTVEDVRSFVSDFGRSLWLSDASVQFRDEPTETWFRTKFLATTQNYKDYIHLLEPLTRDLSYVAEVLPQLYLQAEQYDKLIQIALSDNYLPENPIDARNIRVHRLQFAFKAALKLPNYKDAFKLAMRAGEEVAGSDRQLSLFQSNIDLLAILQSKDKVQEIAFKRLLKSTWQGSENVYSASLLSGISDYHGEARSYLRSALNWLRLCFEEQRKKEANFYDSHVQNSDILELVWSYLNLNGVKDCAEFLFTWTPKSNMFNIVQNLISRLIDVGKVDEVDEFLDFFDREPFYIMATTSALIKVGRFPEASNLETCLDILCEKGGIIVKTEQIHDPITPMVITFLEACVFRKLNPQKILQTLKYYVPLRATWPVYRSYLSDERSSYLKATAIRAVLAGKSKIDIKSVAPKSFGSMDRPSELNNDIKTFNEVFNGLFPWYMLRAQVLYNDGFRIVEVIDSIGQSSGKARANRYGNNDSLPNEIAEALASTLVINHNANPDDIVQVFEEFLKDKRAFLVYDKLKTLHAAHRLPHLFGIRQQLEESTYSQLKDSHYGNPEEIANGLIVLARAVLISSTEDASEYFNEAVSIVSKFGDEIAHRWEGIVSIAKRAAAEETVSNELAYRFIRCAELVGEYVGREKNWNRAEAMQVCTRMSPGIGISALSRWRDRATGHLPYQLYAVLVDLISSGKIPSTVGWSLASFLSSDIVSDFLSLCIENEVSTDVKKSFLYDAVRLYQCEGADGKVWDELGQIAVKHQIDNDLLPEIIRMFNGNRKSEPSKSNQTSFEEETTPADSKEKWGYLFEGVQLSELEGFNKLIEKFESETQRDQKYWALRSLLEETVSRLEVKSLWQFIDVIFLTDSINHYDIQYVLSLLFQRWGHKISLKNKSADIVYRYGQRFAHELTEKYSFDSISRELNLETDITKNLQAGMVSGLTSSEELTTALGFFGFVKVASSLIDSRDAADVVDYALSRFELHIEPTFGDGDWNDRLNISSNINNNIAGFIWSALGSPRSVDRWNGAHCLRGLVKYNCVDILNELMYWFEHEDIGAYGCADFPFYRLHARQYLLIAFARASKDYPERFVKYSEIFSKSALNEKHLLIQKFAADIALNIEKAFAGTYKKEAVDSLRTVGSNTRQVQVQEYGFSKDSPWHEEGSIDTKINRHFGWDFERYWYQPLAKVFGIPEKQIEDLAAKVIVKEWGIGNREGGYKDSRVGLWNSSSYEGETRHSHGTYPRTDRFDFYLSYHAMLVVAARLIEKLPVIKTSDWSEDDPWADWLSKHSLTREDGLWLADIRDPLPLERPDWIDDEKSKSWKADIVDAGFIKCLQRLEKDEIWINVCGNWFEKANERRENFSINTALVSPKTGDALLRALATCDNPHDYKLPFFEEDNMEIDSDIFQLKGWINDCYNQKRLDEYDPYAGQIYYPTYSLGDKIVENLGLVADSSGKKWKTHNASEDVLVCETWSSSGHTSDDDPDQIGIVLRAKLSFLKKLCETFNYDIIFEVSIKRDIYHSYSRDTNEYSTPVYKLLILSSDGKLRTTGADYQLG